MKKLSKILESIWSDMLDRGSGDIIKKEDDIDLLDFDQFYEYLNNRYQPCYVNQNIDRITGSLNYIAVPLLCGRTISQLAIYKDLRIKPYIFMKDVDLYPEFIDTFSLNYDITIDDVEKGWKSIYIYTKGKRNQDEKHTNSFYVQLIDYILDMDKPEQLKNMLERKVNESIWSDMQERGTGDMVKEEDSIDHFEKKQLMDYLRDTYEPLGRTFISGGSKSIYIPFDKPMKKTWCEQCVCIVFDDNNEKDITKLKLFGIDSHKLADIKNILNDFYIEYARSGGVVTLTPKTGKLTNRICVDVLDKMLEIAQKPYYRKQ